LKLTNIFKTKYKKYYLSKFTFAIIFSLILASTFSIAAFNFNNILGPFSGLNIGSFYLRYFAFIDAIVYFILFLSLAQMVFTKVYGEGSKLIGVAIGLALTVSMTVLEMKTGFYIGQIYPIALIIFLLVIAILLFNLFQGLFTKENGKTVSAALTYLIIYGLLSAPFAVLNLWLEQNVPFLIAILALAALAAFIYLIIELFKAIGFGKNSTPTQGERGPQGPPGERGPIGPNPEIPTPVETTTQTPTTLNNTVLPNRILPNNTINPRPPGKLPPKTPRREHPGDPPTNVMPPPGIVPGPEPNIPFEPVPSIVIPETQEILIDLSPHFNPIRSQGNLGSCAAFASTAVFEYELQSENLSPLYDYYKIRELMGTVSKDSGSTRDATIAVLLNNGVCFETPWPYDISRFAETPPAKANIDAAQKKVANITLINKDDPDQWIYALSKNHPLMISINCPKGFERCSGSFYHNINPIDDGGHAMVIVGYHSNYPTKNDSGNIIGIKAFKIRNSWGVNWAENGYLWVSVETLLKIMKNHPAIIKGHKSSDITSSKYKITGRVVFDFKNKKIKPEKTGYQIFSDDNWPNPISNDNNPYYVGAMCQSHGQLKGLGEIKITDPKGRFSFEFSTNPVEFEPLTELNKKFRQFNGINDGINFNNLPSGIIIYKRHTNGSSDKEWFFHITNFNQSFGGRGGIGIINENNPIAQDKNNHNQNCSGIPITFDQKHTHEMNVIIPVPISDNMPKLSPK